MKAINLISATGLPLIIEKKGVKILNNQNVELPLLFMALSQNVDCKPIVGLGERLWKMSVIETK